MATKTGIQIWLARQLSHPQNVVIILLSDPEKAQGGRFKFYDIMPYPLGFKDEGKHVPFSSFRGYYGRAS
jgi:hypothetical protein